jgi:starch phosphorylase
LTARTSRFSEEVGPDNCFIFGLTPQEVKQHRLVYDPWDVYYGDEEIRKALQLIERDVFSMMEPGIFWPVTHSMLNPADPYMLLADLRHYIRTQDQVDREYDTRDGWDRKAILNVSRAGKFSSDRAIREYVSESWHLEPCAIPPL